MENQIATMVRMLLFRDEGKTKTEVSDLLRVHRNTVRLLKQRFKEKGVDGLYDKLSFMGATT